MKFENAIVIDADRETVWREFDNVDNLQKWQPTLQSFTLKSGTASEPGAVSEMVYDEGGRTVVMLETLTEKRQPSFMAGIYESDWSKAVIVNHFESLEGGRTRWVIYANHNFKAMMKVLGIFFRKSIGRRTQSFMEHFKLFVESKIADEKQ